MKKILATAVCALVVLTASAQRANSGDSFKSKAQDVASSVQFGIRAGMNVSNIKEKYSYWGESESEKTNALVGYHIGFIVDVPLYKNYFYIQPGLYLTQKGGKYKENYGSNEKYEEKLNPTYLEIPILFSGRYTFGIAQLQLNFGPYLACGLFGKDKYEDTYNGKKETDSENFFGGDDGFKRFDVGLSLGAGVLLSRHYYIGFQYEFGLGNMIPGDWSDDDESWKMKNRNFMLTVGYNF